MLIQHFGHFEAAVCVVGVEFQNIDSTLTDKNEAQQRSLAKSIWRSKSIQPHLLSCKGGGLQREYIAGMS